MIRAEIFLESKTEIKSNDISSSNSGCNARSSITVYLCATGAIRLTTAQPEEELRNCSVLKFFTLEQVNIAVGIRTCLK